MIESSKYKSENYPRKCFWTPKRETRVKRWSAFQQLGPVDLWRERESIIDNTCLVIFAGIALKLFNF